MNTQLSIKNFRVFDENGVRVDIKPLTILTGCNSSGKSSIVKAAFLLNSFMKQVNEAIEKKEKLKLNKYKLDFTSYPNNLLGRFDKVLPNGASSHKVLLGYTVHSCMISKDVDVQLVFAADKNDDLNNAYLYGITMSTDEGIFYSSDRDKGSTYNLNIIKQYCHEYYNIELLINEYCDLCYKYLGIWETVSEGEFKKEQKRIFEALHAFERDYVLDVTKYIRTKKGGYSYTNKHKELDLLDWSDKNDSYFNIPVLDYLNSFKKNEVRKIVKKELLFNDKDRVNSLSASPAAILSSTNKVLEDFIHSDFETFGEYFKDFEHNYFNDVMLNKTGENPCIFKAVLQQKYTISYPSMTRVKLNFSNDPLNAKENKQSEEEKKKATQKRIKEWEKKPLTFDILYETVMLWNEKYAPGNSDYYRDGEDLTVDKVTINYPNGYHHYAFELLTSFANQLANEVICPASFENMSYVSSSRATVKKLYALDEKDDFTELLQRYFEKKHKYQDESSVKSTNKPDYDIDSFLNHWIKEFGIGESLSFQLDNEGLGVKIYLQKSVNEAKRLLSDEGYGITQLISILLQIETAILSAKGNKTNNFRGLSSFDGYDTDKFYFEENTIAIEEPEIHLHPSYQSKLAEMFVEAYQKYNIHFIIETHSEYLIRKLQTFVAKKFIDTDTVSINYVYSKKDYISPSDSPVKHLDVNEDGSLSDSFGPGFYDEADTLSVELLSLKISKS